jgi:predicted glutamate--cysteine ligase
MSLNPPFRPTSLLKGIEAEVLLGAPDWHAIALSSHIAAQHAEFSVEPDGRNVEFVAGPHVGYDDLASELATKRLALRRILANLGGVRIIPGATLPIERRTEFHITNHSDPYYRFIGETYGDRVVTAGAHISIGFDDLDELFRVFRVLRCEAAMYLALSASSPFYRGVISGYHSTRWEMFPRTPDSVPLFQSHESFVKWMKERLHSGEMFNQRHLWVAVRPNGPSTPFDLDRLELRICDSMVDTDSLLSITALLEARALYLLKHPDLDPVAIRPEPQLLEEIATNEAEAARSSMDAEVIRWDNGERTSMRSWIADTLAEIAPTARRAGLQDRLVSLTDPSTIASPAQLWIQRTHNGESVADILESEAIAAERRDGFGP